MEKIKITNYPCSKCGGSLVVEKSYDILPNGSKTPDYDFTCLGCGKDFSLDYNYYYKTGKIKPKYYDTPRT